MSRIRLRSIATAALAATAVVALYFNQRAAGHCDTLDGPVVLAAKAALEKGDVTGVLKWVKAEGEAEVRAAFEQALTVRTAGPKARELADRYFFETVVRVRDLPETRRRVREPTRCSPRAT